MNDKYNKSKESNENYHIDLESKNDKIKIELEIRPKLILNENTEFRKRTIELFKELEQNESLREAFIKNPVEVVGSRILEKNFSLQQISEANRLLFALLANQKFVHWLDDYATKTHGHRVEREQFAKDFAKAGNRD